MTETCLPIVTWLKNWFTSKDNEIHYNIISSNYNPNIDSTVTITVTVTDGDENTVPNHSFVLNADGTDVSLTTNSQGVATHTYTCSNWGLHTFNVGASNVQINVTGFKSIQSNVTYTLYVDESSRTCRIRASRSNITIVNGESFTYDNFVIPQKYRPIDTSVVPCFRANSEVFHYVFNSGLVGIYNSGSAKTGWNIGFIHEWHY